MGRLDDIVARNHRAQRAVSRGLLGAMAPDLVADLFDPAVAPDDRKRNLLAALIVVGVISAAVAGFLWVRSHDASAILDRRGDRVAIDDLARDHRVIVVLYADRTCTECRRELQELSEHQGELGAEVIGVGADSPKQLDRLRKELGVELALYSDAPLALARRWGVSLIGEPHNRRSCDAIVVIERGGGVLYQSGCGYPPLDRLIGVTHRAPRR
jgi:peroxiredoxin